MLEYLSDIRNLPRFVATYSNGVEIIFHNMDRVIKARLADGTLVDLPTPFLNSEWAKVNLPELPPGSPYKRREWGYVHRTAPDLDLDTADGFNQALAMLRAFLTPKLASDATEAVETAKSPPAPAASAGTNQPQTFEVDFSIRPVKFPFDYDAEQSDELNHTRITELLTTEIGSTADAISRGLNAMRDYSPDERVLCAKCSSDIAYSSALLAGIPEKEARRLGDNLYHRLWLIIGEPAGAA